MSDEPLSSNLKERQNVVPRSQREDLRRLKREFAVFRTEKALLEARSEDKSQSWRDASAEQSKEVERCILNGEVEAGWLSLHAARRHLVYGLSFDELLAQASILRAEAGKFTSWRSQEILKQLPEEESDKLETDKDRQRYSSRVINAMALRDEYFSNQYLKIWMVGKQLNLLLITCGFGLFLMVPLVVAYSKGNGTRVSPWGYQMLSAVLFFGLLGAGFSAAGSLMSGDAIKRVPESVANQFVTSARSLFGAGLGLAGYAFYQAKILDITFGTQGCDSPGAAMTVAFLFGFAGELLITRVIGTIYGK